MGPKQEETKQTYQDITIKMEKVKEKRILKAAREKQSHMQRRPHKDISQFLCRKLAYK